MIDFKCICDEIVNAFIIIGLGFVSLMHVLYIDFGIV